MKDFKELIQDKANLDFTNIEVVENFLQKLKEYCNYNIPKYISLVEENMAYSQEAKTIYKNIILANRFVDLYFSSILQRYFSHLNFFEKFQKLIESNQSPVDYTYVKYSKSNKTYWKVYVENKSEPLEFEALYFWQIIQRELFYLEKDSDFNLFLLLMFKPDNISLIRDFYIGKRLKIQLK